MFWDLHDVQRILPFISSQVFRFLERETCDGFIIIVVVVVAVVVLAFFPLYKQPEDTLG